MSRKNTVEFLTDLTYLEQASISGGISVESHLPSSTNTTSQSYQFSYNYSSEGGFHIYQSRWVMNTNGQEMVWGNP
jgi:hypothetical protein